MVKLLERKYLLYQVSEICKLCHAESIPLIPHGTGTGMQNGVSAIKGGVCLDLTKLSGIEDYHPEDLDVSVRPAVTREDLNHHVERDGLMFTVDPGKQFHESRARMIYCSQRHFACEMYLNFVLHPSIGGL